MSKKLTRVNVNLSTLPSMSAEIKEHLATHSAIMKSIVKGVVPTAGEISFLAAFNILMAKTRKQRMRVALGPALKSLLEKNIKKDTAFDGTFVAWILSEENTGGNVVLVYVEPNTGERVKVTVERIK